MSLVDGCVVLEGRRAWAAYPPDRDALEVYVVKDDLAACETRVLGPDGSWRYVEPCAVIDPPTVQVTGALLYGVRWRGPGGQERVEEALRLLAPHGAEDIVVEAFRAAEQVRR